MPERRATVSQPVPQCQPAWIEPRSSPTGLKVNVSHIPIQLSGKFSHLIKIEAFFDQKLCEIERWATAPRGMFFASQASLVNDYRKKISKKGVTDMNSNELESKWQKLKGEIRSQWGKLTDDDLERIAGNKDKLIGVVQERYGYVWDEARQMVDRYLDDYNGLKTQATEALKTVASRENLHKIKSDVVDFVRRYPIPSLLIGLGVGYLLARRSER